jgi:hypothetical protein
MVVILRCFGLDVWTIQNVRGPNGGARFGPGAKFLDRGIERSSAHIFLFHTCL